VIQRRWRTGATPTPGIGTSTTYSEGVNRAKGKGQRAGRTPMRHTQASTSAVVLSVSASRQPPPSALCPSFLVRLGRGGTFHLAAFYCDVAGVMTTELMRDFGIRRANSSVLRLLFLRLHRDADPDGCARDSWGERLLIGGSLLAAGGHELFGAQSSYTLVPSGVRSSAGRRRSAGRHTQARGRTGSKSVAHAPRRLG